MQGAYLRSVYPKMQGKSSRKSDSVASGNFPSMGIYLINRDTMSRLLKEYLPEATDLGSEVIPAAISIGMKVRLSRLCISFANALLLLYMLHPCLLLLLWQVEAYLFDGYWEDMRSIEAFYHANMECIKRSNMRYKSVAKLPERAERIMQVNCVCEFYKLYVMAPRQLTQTFLPWQLLR